MTCSIKNRSQDLFGQAIGAEVLRVHSKRYAMLVLEHALERHERLLRAQLLLDLVIIAAK